MDSKLLHKSNNEIPENCSDKSAIIVADETYPLQKHIYLMHLHSGSQFNQNTFN